MEKEDFIISLTGDKSHAIKIPLAQGSFAIGLNNMDAKNFDVLVSDDLPINWDCFNTFYTGSGEDKKELYPNGNWPRFFYYSGNDDGFVKWSQKRKIEDFTWSPQKAISVDFSKSNINSLHINVETDKINLQLGSHSYFSISGNVENVKISKAGKINTLLFYPKVKGLVPTGNKNAYKLPLFAVLKEIDSIDVSVSPIGLAFDCESLLQFRNLKNISLSGNITNLQCLEKCKNLERLAIRYVPNIKNLPPLKSWRKLNSFIGWNIEELAGKLLRTELKKLRKERELNYSTVSQLRKLIWFTTEYGIPFSGWTGKNAKIAVRSYKASVKKLKKAKEEQEVKEILIQFTVIFNDLPQIETTEREDIGEAVEQLRQVSSIEIDAEQAKSWFNQVRDY